MRTCASGRGMPPRGEGHHPPVQDCRGRHGAGGRGGPQQRVALRALVVAIDSGDWGVDTWKATLDQVGAAYDVLYTGDTPDCGHAGAAGRTATSTTPSC